MIWASSCDAVSRRSSAGLVRWHRPLAGDDDCAAAAALRRDTPHDPLTLGGVGSLLLVIAVLAMYVPARRAMRVPPIVALNES